MNRLLQLVGAPWDARLVQPGRGEPELAFRLNEEAELLVVLYIIWAG
jgi:hypothetical protein